MFLPILLIAGAYLLGSIPFSYLVVRFTKKEDIRESGSGNVGATNVMRNAGKAAGLTALILDLAKGYLAIVLAEFLLESPFWPFAQSQGVAASKAFWLAAAALAAVVGHIFPLWLGFRGGKGVATATGVFLALAPRAILFAAVIFFIVLLAVRYVSVASMAAAVSIPLLLRFVLAAPLWVVVASIIIALLISAKHSSNISRLVSGNERKFPS